MSLLTDDRSALFDEFLNSYVDWREASDDVWDTYRYWAGCDSEDRPLAFAAYRSALDWEEHAARIHSERARRLSAEMELAH